MDTRFPAQEKPGPVKAAVRQASLRENNLSVVLGRIVAAASPPSRAAIAHATGMTRATASALVDQLVAAGLVEQLEPVAANRAGRPAAPLLPARDTAVALGVEINISYVAARAVALTGEVLADRTIEGHNVGSGPGSVMREACGLAATVLGDLGGARILGGGLAVPGLVDPAGRLRLAPNLGWSDVDVPRDMAAAGWPADIALRVLNEANAGAIAQAHGRAVPRGSFLYVSGEVGVGAGIVLDGRVYPGLHGWSGEVGHLVVNPNGPLCSCGSRGCLEQYVGRPAMARAAGLPSTAKPADLLAALSRGEPAAQRAVATASEALGIALAACVNLLDVPTVLLGGSFAQLADHFLPQVRAVLASRVVAARWEAGELSVEAVERGEEAARTGAAWAVLDDVVEHPTHYMS